MHPREHDLSRSNCWSREASSRSVASPHLPHNHIGDVVGLVRGRFGCQLVRAASARPKPAVAVEAGTRKWYRVWSE